MARRTLAATDGDAAAISLLLLFIPDRAVLFAPFSLIPFSRLLPERSRSREMFVGEWASGQ